MEMVTVVGSFSRVFEGASRGCQANPDPLPNTLRRPSNRSAFRACSSALVRVHPWPWVLVLAAFTAANAAQLSLPSLTAPPGASLLLPVTFASQSAAATGLQFDLQYDDSVITLSATVGGAARISSKSLYLWDVVPGQRRFFILGLNRDLVADGALVNLFVNLSPTAPAGPYPLKLLNVVATGSSAEAVTVNAVDGAVAVQGTAGSGARLQPGGVLNGASLLPGPVAPGGIVTLVGAGIGPALPQLPAYSPTSTVLDGTGVLFDGTPAPLLYGAPNQVNAIAPYSIDKKVSTQVQVTQRGQAIADLQLSVADASPAIFTTDGSGVGQGAILNQDATVNSPSNPAAKGSVIVVFATGAGQTDPAGIDGQIAGDTLAKPLLGVTAQIAGLDAKVLYVGAAPGMVAGVLQVNCVVPLDSPSGFAVPIVLFVGKTSSPAGVTVAIATPEQIVQ
jgi:uncharacterized protein (TIGR03437 family)